MIVNFKYLLVLILFIAVHFVGSAQKNMNNYKYIVVPKSFDFTKGEDQYQLSSITKFLFNKYGFEAYFTDEELPYDLNLERCLALTARIKKPKKGFLVTKLIVELEDCDGDIIFTSNIGDSKLKQYDRAYSESLREAMRTFDDIEYKYKPIENIPSPAPPTTPEIIEVIEDEEEIEEEIVMVEVVKEIQKEVNESDELPTLTSVVKEDVIQLMNGNQIAFIIKETSNKDLYILHNYKGVLYKKDDLWVAEYYKSDSADLVMKSFKVKF
ncbi:MAG: hypothetical protein HRU50_00365 [Winogradskyella sp.]|uniref:hypothetical protein n=1 Tax=Winogradskyella sp. TaxID=1883156 RepID=UPI0025F796E5|nr:hypothetical protein [Winogradskyella sp.]NRB58374.1 hypothetical protein [Winogradskyella sp.]